MKQPGIHFLLVLLFFAVLASTAMAQTPTPPVQPLAGPGGSDYPHAAITTSGPYWANNRMNDDNFKYYIYEPASPAPADAPVILFLHGFAAFQPGNYQAWIEHMTKKGYIVVWAQFQKGVLTPLKSLTPNAKAAYVDALYRLQNFWWEKHVRPRRDTQGRLMTTFVGHSVGAWIAAVMASEAHIPPQHPAPMALTLVEPGTKGLVPGGNFRNISPTTRYVVMIGDMDTVACKAQALTIWNSTPQIPAASKDFLVVRTDIRGVPNQLASHFFPNTDGYQDTQAVDARDFYVTWKLSVAAADCVTKGTSCTYAFGGGIDQLDRGNWSDGQPVIPLIKVDNPAMIPGIPGCNN